MGQLSTAVFLATCAALCVRHCSYAWVISSDDFVLGPPKMPSFPVMLEENSLAYDDHLGHAHRSLLQSTVGQQLCGPNEYFCGGDFVILQSAYAAAKAGKCTEDTDLKMWYCGDEVLSTESYDAITSGANSCPAECSLSSVSASVGANFFWAVTPWSACNAPCDGGVQSRSVTCQDSTANKQVANDLCDESARPANRRPCNTTPCAVAEKGVTLRFTGWGLCSATCGSGNAVRAAFCATSDGSLADVSLCSGYSANALVKQCKSPVACTKPHFSAGPWSPCSAPCDGGTSNRTVTCVNSEGTSVDAASCAGQLALPSSRVCNSAPCVGYTWQVQPWGECSEPCGGGVKTREVVCTDQAGNPATGDQCRGFRPDNATDCNTVACNFCDGNDCSGQGTCQNSVCTCKPGYRGLYCEIAPACPGILDINGNCCEQGILSQNGTCCGEGATLDYAGNCCRSGKLDACGTCNGPSKLVDAEYKCCPSSVLDAGGFCCATGFLDECGVCDGDGTSCALTASLSVTLQQVAQYFQLGPRAFMEAAEAFVAPLLGVSAASVSVSDYNFAPGQALTAAQGPTAADMVIDFVVQPANLSGVSQGLLASSAALDLSDAVGTASTSQLFLLKEVLSIERAPVCGNRICETGERPVDDNTGCPSDCPFQLKTCPGSTNVTTCSNHGLCLSSAGTCECFAAYAGTDCSTCADGFSKSAGQCVRYQRVKLLYFGGSGAQAGLGAIVWIAVALAGVCAMLLVGAIGVIVKQRKRYHHLMEGDSSPRGNPAPGAKSARLDNLFEVARINSAVGGGRRRSVTTRDPRTEALSLAVEQSVAGSGTRLLKGEDLTARSFSAAVLAGKGLPGSRSASVTTPRGESATRASRSAARKVPVPKKDVELAEVPLDAVPPSPFAAPAKASANGAKGGGLTEHLREVANKALGKSMYSSLPSAASSELSPRVSEQLPTRGSDDSSPAPSAEFRVTAATDSELASPENSWMIPSKRSGKPTRLAASRGQPSRNALPAVEQGLEAPGRSVTIEREIGPPSNSARGVAADVPHHEVLISPEDSMTGLSGIVPQFK